MELRHCAQCEARLQTIAAQMICFYLCSLGGTNVKLGLKVRAQARWGELIRRIDCDAVDTAEVVDTVDTAGVLDTVIQLEISD